MECPFPGMDPFLEDPALWPDFQRQLVATLAYQLGLGLSQEHYRVVSKRREHPAGAEDFLEVRAVSNERLVTLVEVVSLANKTTAVGRQSYLDTRQQAKDRGANLVEIDLLLQGQPMLDYSRDGLPEWDYSVTVTRGTQPERYEIYTATVQKRLPRYRVPLSPGDRDTVLDLQADFTRSYAQGGFRDRIDYASEPNVPLGEADRRWLDATLTDQGLRLPMPSQEQVAVAAYYLWEREGRPQGRDREHWVQAMAQLRRRG